MASRVKWYGKEVLRKIDQMLLRKLDKIGQLVENDVKRSMGGQRFSVAERQAAAIAGGAGRKDIAAPRHRPRSKPGQPPAAPTGKLLGSIDHEVIPNQKAVRIGTNVKYAKYLELGTGPYTIRPKTKKALAFVVDGKKVVVAFVRHPGIKKRPFLRPALDRNKAAITRILASK